MEYNFRAIEQKWQQHWKNNEVYKVANNSTHPKYYVLDMFPYPSGAGLHVGHPLGYIASDIYSRYKKLKGFNVLHPMGFDSFGLPAEQYAIETGQHPAVTTKKNIETFKQQLDKIGFCYDWSREVQTSNPDYYKWTQKIFLALFNSFYNTHTQKAEPISKLIEVFATKGNEQHPANNQAFFTASEWNAFTEKQQHDVLMNYRLAFSSYGEVNWCEALGTVLANDEVVNGVSERGGHPVVKKKMRQWYLRITAYADRLLEGLERVDFSDSMKEMQRNWIGRSEGAELKFKVKSLQSKVEGLTVYTTRPDTIFGVDFMVVAPELDWIADVVSDEQKQAVEAYINYCKSRSDRERQAEVKQVTGCFTGAYAINPFNGREIPIYIAEYVLAGYGTGAIMAVPCGDERDFKFAKHFNIPITNIIGEHFNGTEANPTKDAILENSDFLNGLRMKDAIGVALNKIEAMGIGKRKVNYKMRDAGFSRQRYWGEPFPIVWNDGIAVALEETELPLELPYVDKYGPGPEGEGPLANIEEWINLNFTQHKDLTPNPSPLERGTKPQYYTSTPEQWKHLAEFAKANRQNATIAEDTLWQELRNRKIKNAKFRRQHPIAGFIPDFVCLEQKLIVEIDGDYHNKEDQKKYDEARTLWLEEFKYKLIRFTNDEVLHQMPSVLQQLEEVLSLGEDLGEVRRESSTMPGYAGSSWYFLRYMDPNNAEAFVSKEAADYWNQVDLYVGGTEHAVGHLLYSRMWTKVLYDLGYINFDEPFKKLLNQGMIQGSSRFVYRIKGTQKFVSQNQKVNHDVDALHVDVNLVDGVELDIEAFKKWKNGEYANAEFILEDGSLYSSKVISTQDDAPLSPKRGVGGEVYICGVETEKMSKSKYNTVNPNELCDKYGADTFRMYEMFLGPVEQSKPWDTKGIEGVHRFLKKLWRLFYDEVKGAVFTNEAPTEAELKMLHKTIQKIESDTERFSYNTAVSAFMVAVNELTDAKCHKKDILEPLLILLAPYAPHIAAELYAAINNNQKQLWSNEVTAMYPTYNPSLLIESSKEYPVSINGKVRTNIGLSLDLSEADVQAAVLQNEVVQKWLEGKTPKRIVYVKNKMINVVV